MSVMHPAPAVLDPYKDATPELLKVPYPTTQLYDRGWWFNYFWSEARSQLARLPALRSIFKDAFEPKPLPTQANAASIDAGTLKLKPKALSDADMKRVLERVLLIGFKPMEQTPDYIVDASTVFADELKMGMVRLAKIANTRFAYRGELRDVDALCKHGSGPDKIATKRKIDALAMNSDKPWHPFSDPYFRNKHYFRLGSVDNCLHSVISVTDQLYTASKFPLLNDENIYAMPAKIRAIIEKGGCCTGPIDNQDWWQTRKAGVNLAAVVRNGQPALMFWTEVTIYIFTLKDNDQVFHTRQRQRDTSGQDFPEQAVSQIPLDYYLAAVKIRRIHHGMDHTAQGHTAFIQNIKIVGDKPLDLGLEARGVLERKLGNRGGPEFYSAMERVRDMRQFVVGRNERISAVTEWNAKQPEPGRVKI